MPQNRINLRHLRYIAAAAEAQSFRGAARFLRVEQSAISRAIREAEDALGGALFQRTSKGVDLTEVGQRFLLETRRGVEQIETAVAQAQAHSNACNSLRIGVFGPLTMGFLAELFEAFRRDRPMVGLRFSEGGCEELIAAVRRAQLDVGVVAEASPGRGYAMAQLWNEPVYLAMAESDPLAEKETVRWCEVRKRHFVVTDLPTGDFAKAYLQRHLQTPRDALRIEQLSVTRESLMQIVAHGGGVTIAGSAHARLGLSGLTFRLIEDAMLRYGAVYPTGSLQRDLERLLALAKSLSKRDQAWFARQRLIRPEHRHVPHVDCHRGARGRTPDRLQ